MNLTLTDRQFIDCSSDDKKSLIPLIGSLDDMAHEARKKGLLYLEDFAREYGDEFLLQGAMLVVDANEPTDVEKQLDTVIVASQKIGVELLRLILMEEAILSIQKGFPPRVMKDILMNYLGSNTQLDEQALK